MEKEEQGDKKEDKVVSAVNKYLNTEINKASIKLEMFAPDTPDIRESPEHESDCRNVPERKPAVAVPRELNDKESKGRQGIPPSKGHLDHKNVPQTTVIAAPVEQGIKDSKGMQAIPKPKGHSALDYARWDGVEDDSSEDDDADSDEDSMPQYRFRVKTVCMRPVK